MKRRGTIPAILAIARFTLTDELRHKSFLIMALVCAGFVVLMRSCYHGSYTVNGQALDPAAVGWYVSKVSFHVVTAGVVLVATLLAMRAFRRDREEGTQAFILARPISRWQYVSGKAAGLWLLSVLFMFILHFLIFLIAYMNTGELMGGYLLASVVCFLNVLLAVFAALLLSLLLPEAIVFLFLFCVALFSYLGDGIYAASHSEIVKSALHASGAHPPPELTWWKLTYYAWPKLSGLQQWATSLIAGEGFHGFGPVYPLVNILLYCAVLGALLFWKFQREDVA